MAFNNSLSTRLEDLRSRNPQSPPTETSYTGYNTPSRYSGSFMPSHSQSLADTRGSLQRRSTTDSGKMPTITPIGQQPSQVVDPGEIPITTLHKVQLFDKKRMEYEMLKEQRARFEAELDLFNMQQLREKQELDQMAQDLHRVQISGGHQSEPTTPPEYRDQVFPSVFGRRNRFSSSSIASPPGLVNRSSRSGSQLTSPPSELMQTPRKNIAVDKLPSKSVPGSRRGSDGKDRVYMPEMPTGNQRVVATNRYSMPVTGSRNANRDHFSDYSSIMGLGQVNTTGYLFGDDDDKSAAKKETTASPDVKSYLQMNATDDKFPILVRRDEYPGLLSASSAALDLALSQSPGPETQINGWTPFARQHTSQLSLPHNVSNSQSVGQLVSSSSSVVQPSVESVAGSISNTRQVNRRSMEAAIASHRHLPSQSITNGAVLARPSLANMQSSFSTNDIPTLRDVVGLGTTSSGTTNITAQARAQQQFHNHNASLGRIPPNAINNRHSRDLTAVDVRKEEATNGYHILNSALQGSAPAFGPSTTTAASAEPFTSMGAPVVPQQYAPPAYYGGYGMQLMNVSMTPTQPSNPIAFANQLNPYQTQPSYYPYQNYGQPGRFQDSQARVMQQRRLQNGEDNARFTNVKLEHLQGEIYGLCKDQHGCRYLQKKLEERNPEHVHTIFLETNQHVVELMTDPFGNYLCQKLLEYSNDDQRTVLIDNAAPQMVKIALNQHGTRALQKMIEFISTRDQIETIIYALQDRVVELIQDLNGNHVIQKCLNRLTPEDAQFIFDAVGANCVVVGTHRHGCCVLQRCIDHASGHQKAQLIGHITANAYSLVQDPFGNYVLQYIIDLAEPSFTNPMCYSFQGSMAALSKQKFSSNVIEKCLRGAEPEVSRMMIQEMLESNELEKMLRDSFANYVVQTAMDYADPETKTRLIDAIRPILPAIRQTPYGRRIQNKILGGDNQGRLSGISTPNDVSSPGQIPLGRQLATGPSANTYASPNMNGYHGMNGNYVNLQQGLYQGYGSMSMAPMNPPMPAAEATHSPGLSNGHAGFGQFTPILNRSTVHHPSPHYGRPSQVNGFNYF